MSKKQRFCTNCGNQLTGNEKFCGKCGHEVSETVQENSTEKSLNEQESEVTGSDENRLEEEKPDKSPVATESTQEESEVDGTQRQNQKATKKEKKISKIVWTIGIIVALIGVGTWGVYMYNQNSHAVASKKVQNKKAESKSKQKKPKKSHEKNKVYPVKITDISVGTDHSQLMFNEGLWVLKGKTDAPDGSRIVGYVPRTGKYFNDKHKDNVAYDNTGHYFKNGEYTDDLLGIVKNGKFKIIVETSIITGEKKAGEKGEVVITALENPQIDVSTYNTSTKLFNKITNGGTKITLELNEYQAKVANRKTIQQEMEDSANTSSDDSSVDENSEDANSEDTSSEDSSAEESSSVAESSSNGNVVNSPEDAIALAKATYGDNNGDWNWTYLTSEDSNPELDGYFIKAISKSSHTMTGTAKSLTIYPDGTIHDADDDVY